ncbi:type I-E CRISPR-associated protein Cse1/CasA [Roseomonas sp. E05]|uniref:type I-E CRISPR-associated protein Cse1/CasA n=1 Tax=Roseomonas sp. E05 TaxID=3046310 RepID=UPI0024B90B64|nr:type I-E CRISPR-associated protein Cse1/CasA [Roseomonas sp. E05]MDJ0390903.1 type I-E CRISPR-associated protein Cse1/CasA [Roseomonas sp. E05]
MANGNYLLSRYLPAVLAGGGRAMIAPWEIAGTEDGRMPVSLALADNLLNAVGLEMLAGFLQVFAAPADEAEWATVWRDPPSPAALRARFEAAAPMFGLRGERPAFQDRRLADAELRPMAKLFHAVPSSGALAMSEAGAMVALYAMQAHAHGGGRGYRTSLSGGGPLRTVPVAGDTLFRRAWALVLPAGEFRALGAERDAPELRYPWTADHQPSDVIGRASHPATTLYWAVPRRFLLPDATARGTCPLTGERDAALIEGVREKDGGPSYPSELWTHPLTPYRKGGANKAPLTPLRAIGFPDGIGWRHRAGLVADPGEDGQAARIVRAWTDPGGRARRLGGERLVRLHAYGARCDNAKVLGYLDSVQPYRLAPEKCEAVVEREMRGAAGAAEQARLGLRFQLGLALRRSPSQDDWKAMGDVLDEAASTFWAGTERAADALFDAASEAFSEPDGGEAAMPGARERFAAELRRAAVEVFDRLTESSVDQDPAHFAGRRDALHGIPFWPTVRTPLQLPVPERKAGKTKGKAGKEKRN